MHYLGDITLTGFAQPGTLDQTSEAIYAEQATLQGKPSLQRTGSKNDVVSMSFSIHAKTTVPENFIQQLQTAADASTILPLSTEAGDFLGSYVITSINVSRKASTANGSILHCEISVTLLEWATVDGVAERKFAARQNGFAVGVQGQPSGPLTQAVESQAMQSAMATGSGAQAIDTTLASAVATPAIEDHARRSLRERLTTLLADANSARSVINAFGGQKYTDTRGLDTDLLAIVNAATTMQGVVDSASLDDLRVLSGQLVTLVGAMRNSAQILSKYCGTRS
jgi:phage protein U